MRKGLMAVQPLAHTAPVQSTETATEAALKKAEKKRHLCEKCATAHTTASPTVITNPPATATIVLNLPVTADCSPTQIGANITTAMPESSPECILPHVSHDAYNTAQPERLYNLLITATASPPCNMIDAKANRLETITEVLEPADYSLEDIEEVLQKIGKRHRSKGVPIPESMQETAEALRQAVRAQDAAVSPQISTKPITNFDLDTTAPAAIPASAPFLSPVETSTPTPDSELKPDHHFRVRYSHANAISSSNHCH